MHTDISWNVKLK